MISRLVGTPETGHRIYAPTNIPKEACIIQTPYKNNIRVVVKIMVPLWIPIMLPRLIFRVPKKGILILTTTDKSYANGFQAMTEFLCGVVAARAVPCGALRTARAAPDACFPLTGLLLRNIN